MKKISLIPALTCALVAFLFYIPGIAGSPLPGDSAITVVRVDTLYLNSYAQTHALFVLAGHIWLGLTPFFNPAYSLGFLAALFAALTVGVVCRLTARLCDSQWPGLAAAGCLMVSHTMWYHAVFPEVYSLNALFQALVLLAFVEWYCSGENHWVGICFFCGALGCANHLLMGLTLLPVTGGVIYLSRKRNKIRPALTWAIIGGAVGILPLAYLVLRDMNAIGFATAIKMALVGGGGVRGQSQFSYGPAMFRIFEPWVFKQIISSIGFGIYNFVGLACILIILGLVLCWKQWRAPALVFMACATLHFLFGASYKIYEHWAFLEPAWLPLAVFAGIGFTPFCGFFGHQFHRIPLPVKKSGILTILVLVPVVSYAVFPTVISFVMAHDRSAREKEPGQSILTFDEKFRFLLWPPKKAAGKEAKEIQRMLESLPADSTLFLRPSYNAIAYCLQAVYHVAPDVTSIGNSKDDMLAALQAGGRVFVRNRQEARKIKSPRHRIRFQTFNDHVLEVLLTPAESHP